MKKIIAVIVVGIIVVSGAYLIRKRKMQVNSLPPPVKKSLSVYMVSPQKRHIQQMREFLGKYYSVNHPVISSKVSGVVEKVYVREGDKVKKGQLLLQIDDKEILSSISAQRAAIEAAKDSISSLKSSIAALRADFKYAEGILNRNIALYKVGAISKEKLEESRVMMELKKAKLTSTLKEIRAKENELKSLQAQLVSKQHLITYTSIRSPLKARVGKIFLRKGDLVAPGKPILVLYGEKKRVEFSFPTGLLQKIKVGQKVYIGNRKAKITTILPYAANSLGLCYIDLSHPLNLPENSNVSVDVVIKEAEGTSVPLTALLERGDGTFVFVYHKGKGFFPKRVKVLATDNKYAVISPSIQGEVAIGSSEKLSRLFVIKDVRGIRYE